MKTTAMRADEDGGKPPDEDASLIKETAIYCGFFAYYLLPPGPKPPGPPPPGPKPPPE